MKDDTFSHTMLYEHNKTDINADIGSQKTDDDELIVVLGFFGGSIHWLKRKYSHLGPTLKKDILAVPCIWRYLYFEGFMWKWVKKNLDSYYSNKSAKKKMILVVSSGGGTVLYSHLLKWLRERGKQSPEISRIMWEYAPGSILPDEYYRATKRLINLEKSILLRMVVYPLIVLSCKVLDFFTDYAARIRETPWIPELVPDTVCSECCIANLNDPILDFSYVDAWITKMESLGRHIKLKAFDTDGHLDGHKANPEAYLKFWKTFVMKP